jgi:chromosome partitioning protein
VIALQQHAVAGSPADRVTGVIIAGESFHLGKGRASLKAEIIAIANHKGGVGKSFTAANLAAGLARGGWRTLLADCDAQANATSMFDPDDDVEFDLYDLIKNETPITKVIRATRIDSLDLLPSTLAIAQLDQELVMLHRREYQMAMALEPVHNDYDAILLDLPPNLGQLVITGLNAADWLIIPCDASKWGARGVRSFLQWSAILRKAQVLSAELLGVLLTKYEAGTLISQKTLAELRDDDLPLFDAIIPKRTAAERMITDQRVLGDVGADTDLAQAYANFTVEVMQRVDDGRRRRGRHRRG